ncbi:MAG: helix-turn-helix domain-containing protein [Halanaerobiales bacterium]
MNLQKLGSAVKELRLKRGLSQTKLGELTEFSRSHIASIERGAYSPSVEALDKIAKALNVNTSYFILKAEEAETETHELFILDNEFKEGITVLKEANKKLSESQKRSIAELIDFYTNQELKKKEDKK